MIAFDAVTLDAKDHYKFLSGAIIPRPIAFVTTVSEDGILNAAPFSFFNVVSSNPPIVSLAVQRDGGMMKDTARNVLATGELVIHLVDETLTEDMNATAARLAPNDNELLRTKLTTTPSVSVKTPAVQEAKIRMEAKLFQHIPIPNEAGEVVTDLILAKISYYVFDNTVFDEEKHYIDATKMAPVARLAGNDYAKLGDVFTVTRPN
ncbi:flavin reductase family protein [Listeria booriae]|uniref:flavin reductase family protein n=1 Tax=Listeria booriae TaxID=1552123 RepID=UPI00162A1A51|nr:flavin reductase family protein [Listeria booriae]MBC1897035.1 flavin reductase family protein [Listeria booriae]MBC1985048.1 flavin reductase family protein [Listeria booriae]MBC2020132.1 flavin reductase family protein [Listeria booriae]MBC2047151.1 flavin reductase family protein [Listeria booriae]MBC2327669.1 flavin reductase family protein [Listeria booriae]